MLRVKILFWDNVTDTQRNVGDFVLGADRTVRVEPHAPDGLIILTSILRRAMRADDSGRVRVHVEEDAERWMRLLPSNYDGAYVRAKLEETGP